MAIVSDLCKCLETGAQDVLDQMTGRINKIIRDKTRLNNLLKRAPQFNLTPPNLSLTLDKALNFEAGLEDAIGDGFPFPGEGDVSLGQITRCLQVQIDLELSVVLELDLAGLGLGFCNLNRFADLLQNLVDDLIPNLDAQVNFGCDPGTKAALDLSLSNALGSVGASTDGTVGIETLTADSLGQVGQGYLDDFNSLVKCCLNIQGIKDTVKSFVKDPFTGQSFNPITFEPIVSVGGSQVI
jgi:hypothetical protein